MMAARGNDLLRAARDEGEQRLSGDHPRITVGLGTCGKAASAQAVFDELAAALADSGRDDVVLDGVGCRGLCSAEPLVEAYRPDGEHVCFGRVTPQDAARIIAYATGGATDDDLGALAPLMLDEPLFAGEERRVMERSGLIDPTSIGEYLACGGYAAFIQALEDANPAAIIAEVEASGLRGRGGAGFPTGAKWRACAQGDADERFFIVNGDEGDPGAYMDRSLLESDPHLVLEGLMLGCAACGASRAYVFIRAEYPQAVTTMQRAIDDAYRCGLLGSGIAGTGFSLDVSVIRGAGAFLCGESTALANVLEGKPCMPRTKPPHLAEKGLWDKPTCVNNVETLANVPLIMRNGADWYRQVGTAESPGTKILSITGAVERTGLAEVAFGTPLAQVVEHIAGARDAKAVQVGGPSGAILPAQAPVDISYEGLAAADAMVGSGGFVVLSDAQCVVDTAAYLTRFSQTQSCGKCRACRTNLAEAADTLERICAGEGTEEDLSRLRTLAIGTCADTTLCGLGSMALRPLITSLAHFPDEYRAHLAKACPALVCKPLISYVIDETKCQGERCCLGTCPGNAIKGPFGKPGRIVTRLCQKCGACVETCCYDAVKKITGTPPR